MQESKEEVTQYITSPSSDAVTSTIATIGTAAATVDVGTNKGNSNSKVADEQDQIEVIKSILEIRIEQIVNAIYEEIKYANEVHDLDRRYELEKARLELQDQLASYFVQSDKEVEYKRKILSAQERESNGWRVLIGSIINVVCALLVLIYNFNDNTATQTHTLTLLTTLGPLILAVYFLFSANSKKLDARNEGEKYDTSRTKLDNFDFSGTYEKVFYKATMPDLQLDTKKQKKKKRGRNKSKLNELLSM